MNESEKKFLLYGMYGSINVGDELVCYAVTKGLQRHFNDPAILVASFDKNLSEQFIPSANLNFYNGRCFHYKFWLYFFNILNHIKNADVIVIGGGGLFQDQYSWHLPSGSTLMAGLGILMSKPTFITGVGVGPISRKWLRKIMSWIFPHVTDISVRDTESRDTLVELGISPHDVNVTADVVPSLDLYHDLVCCDSKKDANLAAFILRDWKGLDYRSTAKLLDTLTSKGYRIQLHCFEPVGDSRFYDKILSFCSKDTLKKVEKIIPPTLRQSVEAIGKAAVVVSMRLHGCIIAIGLDVPLIPVVYERKVRAFIKQMELDTWLKEVNDLKEDLLKDIESAPIRWKKQNKEICECYKELKKKSSANFELISNKLNVRGDVQVKLIYKIKVFIAVVILLLFGFSGGVIHLMCRFFAKIARKTNFLSA